MLPKPVANALIHLRETALGLVLKIDTEEVLNPRPSTGAAESCGEIARQLKAAVNEIKLAAVDEDGRRVDYARLKGSPSYQHYTQDLIPKLHAINLGELGDNPAATAFWINLYNALVMHAVMAYGVRESITEGGAAAAMGFFRRTAYTIGGLRFSLEDIEHGALRANRGNPVQHSPQFAPGDARMSQVITPLDPRMHFALNCASRSCPPIAVYTPENLDDQLDLAAANFIQQEAQLIDDQMWLSQIFNWYRKDFGGQPGVVQFLVRYLPADDPRRRWLADKGKALRFRYTPYDWTLNF